MAKQAAEALDQHVRASGPLKLRIREASGETTLRIPAAAAKILVRILSEMARGNSVTVFSVRAQLTTQGAAELLNISRPSLIRLLEDGKIEYRRVGTHRRVRAASLMAYKRAADAERRAVLAELAAYDQEIGI